MHLEHVLKVIVVIVHYVIVDSDIRDILCVISAISVILTDATAKRHKNLIIPPTKTIHTWMIFIQV